MVEIYKVYKVIKKMHKAKKSLGQNFLKSKIVLDKIIEAGEVANDDIVLEIGPGKGALTEKLLDKTKQIVAVEKDDVLIELLQEKFSKEIRGGSLVLIHDDILEFDIDKVVEGKKYKIIANIPYNITGAILKKFLTSKHQPESMILMVQHEVAKRILARDGKESLLSISVKAYGEPKMIMKVPARYFSPSPKVDSAVIAINHISRKLFIDNLKPVQSLTLNIFEEKFWGIVHAGFAHKRKKLSNNLKNIIPEQKKEPFNTFANKRAEDLTLSDWISLTF